MRSKGSLLFAILMTVTFALIIGSASTWDGNQRLFPIVMGIPGLILSVVAIIHELRRKGRPKEGEHLHSGLDLFEDPSSQTTVAQSAIMFGWIFGLGALIWLVSFMIAVPIFTMTYVKLQGREGWLVSAGITALVMVIFIGFFDRILAIPWPEGAVQRLIGL